MVPFTFADKFWLSTTFWIGFIFVTFPLNYLVYGLNDVNDFKADRENIRKGNFLFGAKESLEYLQKVPCRIALVILPFIVYFVYISGIKMFFLLIVMIFFNVIYNYPPLRLKERPPFEILIQIGYVTTALFSVVLNNLALLPFQTLIYLSIFAFHSHIAGEIMDIGPDLLSGKKTTATIIGRKNAKLLMLFLLIVEVIMLTVWFQDFVLAGSLSIFGCWLVLDIYVFFKDKPYLLNQMKIFGLAINIAAIASMIWILYSGKLLNPIN